MNMLDTRKMTRGITLWREDVLKYHPKNHNGRSLSEFIRDLLHARMQKYRLTEDDKAELQRQIAAADAARRAKRARPPIGGSDLGRKLAYSEAITIPAKVRARPRHIKGK